MAKKATDLLDVFRLADAQTKGGSRRRPAGSRSAASRGRSGFDGLFLAPRQLLLVSSVLVLLLVLSFTVGLGFGRRSGLGRSPDLQRVAPRGWFIRAKVPRVDRDRDRPFDAQAFLRELERVRPGLGRYVRVVPSDQDLVYVFIGPWSSEADARDYHRKHRLDTLRLQGGSPFHFVDFVQAAP